MSSQFGVKVPAFEYAGRRDEAQCEAAVGRRQFGHGVAGDVEVGDDNIRGELACGKLELAVAGRCGGAESEVVLHADGGIIQRADGMDIDALGLEARHSFAQDRLKPEPRGELPTEGFTLVNADASWRLSKSRHDVLLTLQVTNLLNQDARQHTSFRKDVAPLPGIGVVAGVRWTF